MILKKFEIQMKCIKCSRSIIAIITHSDMRSIKVGCMSCMTATRVYLSRFVSYKSCSTNRHVSVCAINLGDP